MSGKIILGDLDKHLFPEVYPYFNAYFDEEEKLLRNYSELDETTHCNISFKIKTTQYSRRVKGEDLREYFYHIFDRHVELFYDWRKEYDWFELKSILAFWIVFSSSKNSKEFRKRIKDPKTMVFLRKYLPEPVVPRIPL